MQKFTFILSLLICSIFSLNAIAEEAVIRSIETPDGLINKVLVTREQMMSIKVLASIADLSSARNQQGKPVALIDELYFVGSFTKTTISVVPPYGGVDDIITLDLLNK